MQAVRLGGCEPNKGADDLQNKLGSAAVAFTGRVKNLTLLASSSAIITGANGVFCKALSGIGKADGESMTLFACDAKCNYAMPPHRLESVAGRVNRDRVSFPPANI